MQPAYMSSVTFWGKFTSGSRISASRSDLLKLPVISVGELALLTCEVSGDPKPSVMEIALYHGLCSRTMVVFLLLKMFPVVTVVFMNVKHLTNLAKAEHLTSICIDLICISTAGTLII